MSLRLQETSQVLKRQSYNIKHSIHVINGMVDDGELTGNLELLKEMLDNATTALNELE